MKSQSRKTMTTFLIVTMIFAMFVTGCSGGKGDDSPIVLASLVPLTGTTAEYGQYANDGINLAIEEINAAGGVLGKKLVLKTYDDKGTAEDGAAAAEIIVADESIVAVASAHYASSVALVTAQIFQENGIPMITPSASHPDLCLIGDYIFRNNVTDKGECQNVVQLMHKMGFKRYGILALTDDFGETIVKYFKELQAEIVDLDGGELVCVSTVPDDAIDFSANVSEFIAADCDVILSLANYSTAAAFAVQLSKQRDDIPIVGMGSIYNPAFIELGGEAVEGSTMLVMLDPNSKDPYISSFVKTFEEKYGYSPNYMAHNSYDSTKAIAAAIVKAESIDREAIKNALYEISIEGTTGKISFNEEGECPKAEVVLSVQNGEFVGRTDIIIDLWDDYVDSLG